MSMSADTPSFRRPFEREIAEGAASFPLTAGVANRGASDGFQGVRTLIWVYFWLLMFEGVLRKWIFPEFANQLLVVRDPVLLLCYFLALKKRAFPRTIFMVLIVVLGLVATLFSGIGISTGETRCTLVVLLYGLRAAFGHLPMIFLIGRVFGRREVERVGRWLLVMALPMALLVYLQYQAGTSGWVNAGAGLDSEQAGVAVYGIEKIRPPGIFSFNTGLTAFVGLVSAYLVAHFLSGGKLYWRWLGILASCAVVACVPLSVSRSTVGGLVVIGVAAVLCVSRSTELFTRGFRILLLIGVAIAIVGSFSFFREGLGILQDRFKEGEGIKVGVFERLAKTFTRPMEILSSTPFLGAGLGVGTNVGSKLITGTSGFLLSEGDWERDIDEMGPLVGLFYIFLRVGIAGYMVSVGWKSLKRGSTLSILLAGAGGLSVLNGNFAQPTSLGFAVFTGGLCLAAAKNSEIENLQPPSPERILNTRIRGRSVYAEQLHGSPPKG